MKQLSSHTFFLLPLSSGNWEAQILIQMKKTKLFGWAFVALASFSACTNDTEDILTQESEIKLTSEITPSRVNSLNYQSTQIVQGQQVGVTIIGARTEHNNVAWIAGSNGILTNTGSTLYWGKSDVSIRAYHPFNADWTGSCHTFSVNTDQSSDENYLNSDLLWTSTTASKSSNPISLNFLHKLAKINVTLTSEDIDDLSNATISICGTNITTDFNPNNGELSNSSNTQDIIAGTTTVNASTAAAIIVPQTIPNGTHLIKVSHNNKNFIYTLPVDKTFESGHSYSYTLNIKEKLVEVEVESDNITDWNDEGITGDLEEVVETLLLPDGPTFNLIVGEVLTNNTNLKKIKFIANSEKISDKILIIDEDGTIGYIVENGEWLEIHSPAEEFIAHAYCGEMFSATNHTSFKKVVSIDFGNKFNTSNVYSTCFMFNECTNLSKLNVSNFDTSNFIDVSAMFQNCNSLTSLDLSNFNTSKIKDMSCMFYRCVNLTSLDVSNFDTSNVTDMYQLFCGCEKLSSLDVSNFNTSNVTNMYGMFYVCSNLSSIDVSRFDTSKVTNMGSMFGGCSNLTAIDISNFDTSNVNIIFQMFDGCEKLTNLDVTHFDTSNVTDMSSMFQECSSLTSLNVSNFNTSNVTNMCQLFSGCSNLTSLDVTHFDTSNVTDMTSMFMFCTNLTSLNLNNFDTSNVTDMCQMFDYCTGLTSLDLSNFNTSNVTDMRNMFLHCENVLSFNLSSFNTSNVEIMANMFTGCQSLSSLNISNFDTSNVTDMGGMFSSCYNLENINISNFNTSNVTRMLWMFAECSKLSNIDLSNFNTTKVTEMGWMFNNCQNLKSVNLSSFNTSNVTDFRSFFGGCSNLTNVDLTNFSFAQNPMVTEMYLEAQNNQKQPEITKHKPLIINIF